MSPTPTTATCEQVDTRPLTPDYLQQAYSWAYVTPEAVRRFERQWLVNLILWGNFARLRDLALDAMGDDLTGDSLQVACVYGDLTARWAARHRDASTLEVIDVLPVQIDNLRRKLGQDSPVRITHANSASLPFDDASKDRALLFFLLHEQPEDVRRCTVREAFRVVKPGGKLLIVDYHRPRLSHPLYLPMKGILAALEPFALDLWRHEIAEWFAPDIAPAGMTKRTYFGDLYQIIEITR